MSFLLIKLIAIFAMIMDHIGVAYGTLTGYGILTNNISQVIGFIGRISFPIFAFGIVNGWVYSKNREKYFSRMILFSSISQIPYTLATYPVNLISVNNINNATYFSINKLPFIITCIGALVYWYLIRDRKWSKTIVWILLSGVMSSVLIKINYVWIISDELNVFFTLALGIVSIYIIDVLKNRYFKKWYKNITLLIVTISTVLIIGTQADYGKLLLGIILIISLYIAKKYRYIQALVILIWGAITYGVVYNNWLNFYSMFFVCAIILAYNGEKGRNTKYILYYVYPIHLLIIGFINMTLKFTLI